MEIITNTAKIAEDNEVEVEDILWSSSEGKLDQGIFLYILFINLHSYLLTIFWRSQGS